MNTFRRCTGSICIGFTILLSVLAGTQQTLADDSLARQWSQQVWRSAMDGDQEALDRYLNSLFENASLAEKAGRFRETYEQHLANAEKAQAKREEDRQKASEELQEHLASDELAQALRAAVTVQTLSDNMNDALENPDIVRTIEWARQEIPKVEAELDWLRAQELLYYLRTLFEDTERIDEYRTLNDELTAVNRRVALLAQYAPRELHKLRVQRAQRLGEEPPGEFKPNRSNDWRERVRGIRPDMLKAAMRTAASEHIETAGWRPLLRGGLESLRLLATTKSLEETFPGLGDPEKVRQWVAYINNELAEIEQAADADLNSWTLSDILDKLLVVNDQTIQLEREIIYREFGDGAMSNLDEFSEIVWPDSLARFRQATEGQFVGVGILIRHNDTQEIVVVKPLEGTPAYFGGVKPEDVIVEVNGESTMGWTLSEAVDRITGERDTKVTLGLKRSGVEGIMPITLTREQIKLPSVMGWWKRSLHPDGTAEWDWYVDHDNRIAYVKITQFTDDTYADLRRAWQEISQHGKPSGVILDLRFNPGGLLTSAVQVSNLFVPEGVIVSGEDKNGRRAWPDQRARPHHALDLDGVATVVLINQGSASASEIVAGALQAHGAAVIVGERSFGKGSVQTVHPTAANARLKLTTQYYRLPPKPGDAKGRLVHKRIGAIEWGVEPDIVVKMTPQQITEALELRQEADVIPQDDDGELNADPASRPDVNRLITEGLDPQLSTALLILQARALGAADSDARHASSHSGRP